MIQIHALRCFILVLVISSVAWKNVQIPKIFGDSIPEGHLSTKHPRVQTKIVYYHNLYRSNVLPRAANMLRMKWNNILSKSAQRWADECLYLIHDTEKGRKEKGYGPCGQNIFVASHKVPWFFAVRRWFMEYRNFTFGSTKNNLHIVGHYTQMVWAASHQVGCGISKCLHNNTRTFYNYVCNYCPSGNKKGFVGRPYIKGKSCASCKEDCYKGKLCTNSCPVADVWSNCRKLFSIAPKWLCHDKSARGKMRFIACRATCSCKRKIY